MQLFTIGINHHTAPLSVREQVVFQGDGVEVALRDLVDHRPVQEAALVSTCNRTELYCNTEEPAAAIDWLAEYHRLSTRSLQPYVYALPTAGAVKHAFRVASGLDSMVVGEPQILGQFKQAVKVAEQAGTLGVLLHKLFQRTFSVAKEVRTHTEIGASSVSMAACAVHLAERIFASVAEQSVLFIGAGEMIELCAAHFCAARPRRVTFANRTLERAEELAGRYGAAAITLTELVEQLPAHDIVVTCTASPLPIIGKGTRRSAPSGPAAIGPCSWWIWRCRATSRPKCRDSTTSSSTPWTIWVEWRRKGASSARSRGGAGRSDHRPQGPGFHALAREPRGRAHHPRAAGPGGAGAAARDGAGTTHGSRAARIREQVLDYLSRSLTNKLLHAPTHALAQRRGRRPQTTLAMPRPGSTGIHRSE